MKKIRNIFLLGIVIWSMLNINSFAAEISSEVYRIEKDNCIVGILPKTKIGDIKRNLANTQSIKCEKGNTQMAMSGDIITVNNVNYSIVVCGDLDGNGIMTVTDLLDLKQIMVKLNPYNKAGDVNGDGKITPSDLLIMKLILAKKKNIQELYSGSTGIDTTPPSISSIQFKQPSGGGIVAIGQKIIIEVTPSEILNKSNNMNYPVLKLRIGDKEIELNDVVENETEESKKLGGIASIQYEYTIKSRRNR